VVSKLTVFVNPWPQGAGEFKAVERKRWRCMLGVVKGRNVEEDEEKGESLCCSCQESYRHFGMSVK